MGFTDYFLLVGEVVGFARARGIPTVGRGSGASSIVSYVLGVTNVDPIRYGLCFERFLHPQRRDCPDLDVDLCWQRRDEVIEHVYRTYGDDRVAMISTHATLGARSAFREAAKVLGVPLPRVNALARRVPRHLEAAAVEQALASGGVGPLLGHEFTDARATEALRLAAKLAGAPRHLSVHCGGLVIGDRALTHYLPLERAAKGVVVSQFEMRAVERIGLVKMDLLGNRAISTIGECVELVSRWGEDAAAGSDAGTMAHPTEDARTGSAQEAESGVDAPCRARSAPDPFARVPPAPPRSVSARSASPWLPPGGFRPATARASTPDSESCPLMSRARHPATTPPPAPDPATIPKAEQDAEPTVPGKGPPPSVPRAWHHSPGRPRRKPGSLRRPPPTPSPTTTRSRLAPSRTATRSTASSSSRPPCDISCACSTATRSTPPWPPSRWCGPGPPSPA